MENSVLSIDICETIIDMCHDSWEWEWGRDSYQTWCNTSLVCSDWVPRSRLNLLHEVRLRRTSDVYNLLRTLLVYPHLAGLITKLSLYSLQDEYIPFAHPTFARLLTNCKVLDFGSASWHRYPPRYAATYLRGFSEVVQLTIRVAPCTFCAIMRFIWDLPALEDLRLIIYDGANYTFPQPVSAPDSSSYNTLKSVTIVVRIFEDEYARF